MFYSLRKLHGTLHDKKTKLIKSAKIKYDIRRSIIQIMTIDETLDCLAEGKSIARFGDGELDLIFSRSIRYQSANTALAKSLRDILNMFIVKLKYRNVQNKNVGNCTYKM